MIALLSGNQFAEKVSEHCKAYWEAEGVYGEAEANALQQFKAAFKNRNLLPGSSVLFTCSSAGFVVITPISLISFQLAFFSFQRY